MLMGGQRVTQRLTTVPSQRRWATTGTEKVEEAVEGEAAPPVAESANLTEATEEALPAAEINENLVAQRSDVDEGAPAIAESANLTEATEETLPAPGADEFASMTPRRSRMAERYPNSEGAGFEKKQTIYVGNLFFDISETDLVREFTEFGTVVGCKVVRDARGLSKGFAYIDFAQVESAEKAVATKNMQLFEGRRMAVQYAARNSDDPRGDTPRKPVQNPPSRTLFIGNMSFEMTDRDLSNLFRGVRNVIDVRVAIDRRTGQPRGFAHADFVDVKSAMEAFKYLQEKETYGRKLRVDYSYNSSHAPRNQTGLPRAPRDSTDTPTEPQNS